MPAPIDYGVKFQDPLQSFLGAYQAGSAIQQADLAQQQRQRELEQQKLITEGFNKLRQPGATAADYANLAMLLPETQAKSVREAFAMKSSEQQQNTLSQAGQVFAAFKSGKPEIAIDLMDRQIEAKRNSGDEQGAKFLETWRDVAKTNPKAAEDYFGFTMSQVPGGDKVIEGALKLTEERRAAEKAPFELTKAESEAVIKSAEAKFAPDKFGAELGLTKAQIDQAKASAAASRASAAASGAEAKRKTAEAQQMASGVIPLDKRPEAEGKMRKEYSDQTKGYQEVKSAYGRVLSAEDTAVGDLSLIFGYMKMLDPGSVVREGEFATAQNAAGVPERIQNIYNRAVRGERLTPGQRKSFKGQAEKLYQSSKQHESTVRSGISRIAKGYGLSTENIFYEPSETAPAAPTPTSAPSGGVQVTAPNGQTLTFPSQQAADAFKQAAGIR